MQIFKTVLNAFFPNTCIACGDIIEDGEQLCDYCFEMLPRVDISKVCKRCGNALKQCDCNNHVFYFNGCVSPFYNDGVSQKAMYKFKFSKREENAEFFAQQMCLSVKTVFCDIAFDAVTFVPMNLRKRLKRGFNQSEILAGKISKILNIPLLDNLLYCKKSKVSQHDLSNPKERFKNVDGLYGYKKKVKINNILLVDDIKTTGATLNECAKQLVISGVDNIYCVTGLITERKKSNGN